MELAEQQLLIDSFTRHMDELDQRDIQPVRSQVMDCFYGALAEINEMEEVE